MTELAPALLATAALLALAIDRWVGEPPAAWHPVVWMGNGLARLGARLWPLQPVPARLAGAGAWCLGALACAAVASAAQWALLQAPMLLGALGLALLLKPLLAWRMLRDEVVAVEQALGRSLDAGRAQLA